MKNHQPFGIFFKSFLQRKSFFEQQLKHPFEFISKLIWSHLFIFIIQKPSFIYNPSICTLPSCRKSWDKNLSSILYELGSRLSLILERSVLPVALFHSIYQYPQYSTFIPLREATTVEVRWVEYLSILQSPPLAISSQEWRFCFYMLGLIIIDHDK